MQAEMVAVLIRIYAAFLINVELPAVSGAHFTRPLTHSRTLWTAAATALLCTIDAHQ